jgi:hypothetical protein
VAASLTQVERQYWDILGVTSEMERQRIAAVNEQHLTWRLERLLTALGDARIGPVCTGIYVSTSFHAAATPVDSGTVILVHDQLIDVTIGITSLLAASVPWQFGGEEAPPTVSETDALRMIGEIAESSVLGGAPVSVDVKLAEPRWTGFQMLLSTVLNFVVAHELAHVALGHLAELGRGTRSSGLPTQISMSSWRHEFAADEHAFRTAAVAFPSVATEAQYLGPVLLFEIVDLAGELRERADRDTEIDVENYGRLLVHPSAAARRSALINGTHPDGPRADLPLVDDLVSRMRSIVHSAAREHVFEDDLERLRQFAAECDVERYNAVMRIGEAVDGSPSSIWGPSSTSSRTTIRPGPR